MYRHVSHITVKDVDAWNEVLEVIGETNAEAERLGVPTATVWTETVGPFNNLQLVVEYDSLAEFEESNRKLYASEKAAELASRMSPLLDGHGYTELFERADSVGG